jgi:hypothetical protein
MNRQTRSCAQLASVVFVALLTTTSLSGQSTAQGLSFGICKPVSEWTAEVGCWIVIDQLRGNASLARIGSLPVTAGEQYSALFMKSSLILG